MDIGIFSKIFKDHSLDKAFKKISDYNITTIQFNFSNVGLESLPVKVNTDIVTKIKNAQKKYDISIPVVSGTFNTLEMTESKHNENIKRFNTLVEAASMLEIPYVSISTGSFNQEDFWSPHPDNHSQEGWNRLYSSLDEMLKIVEKYGVTIVVEPEQANVVSNVQDISRLLNHYKSQYLKVLYDPANIVEKSDYNNLHKKISATLHELKEYIAIAHCKDCIVTEDDIQYTAVGKGNLPLNYYISELRKYYNGPVIMHGLDEGDIDYALNYLEY